MTMNCVQEHYSSFVDTAGIPYHIFVPWFLLKTFQGLIGFVLKGDMFTVQLWLYYVFVVSGCSSHCVLDNF